LQACHGKRVQTPHHQHVLSRMLATSTLRLVDSGAGAILTAIARIFGTHRPQVAPVLVMHAGCFFRPPADSSNGDGYTQLRARII
jgi:hypothetical protein